MSIESRCTIGAMASKKASASSPVSAADRVGQRRRGEGAGRDDDAVPLRRRQPRSPRARISISGCAVERRRDGGGKAVAVDRERAAGRHLVGVGRAHDQRAEPAHLLVQQADGVVSRDRRSGTSWSRPARRARRSCARRSCAAGRISCSTTGTPRARDLPGGLGAGEAAADDVDRLKPRVSHGPSFTISHAGAHAFVYTDSYARLCRSVLCSHRWRC